MEKRKLVIIGSGPAGYAAAIYTARAELEPLMIAGEKSGGQLMLTTGVENYPGFRDGIQGPELMMEMREQAGRFGTDFIDKNATGVDFSKRPFEVMVGEDVFAAEAVILTTGAESVGLGVPGERDYSGRGVSYCAVCDAAFFRGKRVFVVGGGDAAMEDTLALVKFADKISLVHRRDQLRASKIMQKRVLEDNKDKVDVWWNTEVVEVVGDEKKVTGIRVKYNDTGKEEEHPADGLFLAIGHKPMTKIFANQVELDEKGYVVTRVGLGRQSVELAQKHLSDEGLVQFPTTTSVEGVFAAGDVVDFRYRQAATAAGFGVMAALDAERWLERG